MLFKFNDSDVIRNTIRCYPDVEFLIYSGGNVVLNKRISEGQTIYSGSYSRKEVNVDRISSQRINPFIYKNQYYDAIDGSSLASSSYGSIVTGTYVESKGYTRYWVTSTSQPEYTTINRLLQGYRKHISGPLDGVSLANNQLNLQSSFCAFLFNREIYGSRIKEGSVELRRFYIDGREQEVGIYPFTDRAGVLYSGYMTRVGYVLYDYGIIIIDESGSDEYLFGDQADDIYASFSINFKGTHDIQNLTMFCVLDKKLNMSNNPTYILKGQSLFQTQSSSDSFKENDKLLIKNLSNKDYIKRNIDFINENYNSLISTSSYNNMIINTSSFGDDTFEKGVYVTSINIYDKDRNLIAVANFANPIRKTEAQQYIAKLSIDM